MAARTTTHVIPTNGTWIVKRASPAKGRVHVFATRKEAVQAAREIVRKKPAGQVVVHELNGSMRAHERHGLPVLQKPPVRSKIGRKAIEKAVSAVIRERVLSDNKNVSQAITKDPETMHGVPVFRGTRVPVQTLFD